MSSVYCSHRVTNICVSGGNYGILQHLRFDVTDTGATPCAGAYYMSHSAVENTQHGSQIALHDFIDSSIDEKDLEGSILPGMEKALLRSPEKA